ncbi:hypothetical protein B0J14DRAFT_567802 [Halenospora varia]|nr:hypothetical protein B0J14DRAFT_567802 [Halenospora varia]
MFKAALCSYVAPLIICSSCLSHRRAFAVFELRKVDSDGKRLYWRRYCGSLEITTDLPLRFRCRQERRAAYSYPLMCSARPALLTIKISLTSKSSISSSTWTMDSRFFYKPSASQPSRSSVARMTAATPLAYIAAQSLTSTGPVASVGIAGIDTTPRNFSQRSDWEDQNRIEVANVTDLAPKGRPPGQQIRIDDLIQKQGNSGGAGNYSNSNSDDNDKFPSLEQLPSYMEKKHILARAEQNTSRRGEEANNQTQGDSPVGCSGSTSSSCQDSIWISDDESDTASQIDGSDLDSDSTAEADCNHLFGADKGPAGGQALNSGTTPPSSLPAANSDDDNNKGDDVVHNVQVQSSADGHKLALFRHSSVSHQASELQQNTKVTTDSTKHVSHNGPDEPEDYVFDVFAEEDDEDGSNTQPKPPKDSAVSGLNSTPNTRISEPQNAQRATQSSELAPTVAALQQSDPKGTLPPAHRPRKAGAGRRGPKSSASFIKLTAGGSTTSTDLEFLDAGESHSGKPITDPNNFWKARTIVGRRVQYCVGWEPTWHFESELEGMKVSLDEFEAKLLNAQGQSKNGRGKRDRKSVVTAPNKLWEGTIIGRRIIGGRKQYRVEWKPTWEPELKLTEVKELIDEFVANNQGRRGRQGQKRSRARTEDLDAWSESEPSKRRRRAQKQELL